MVLDKNNPVLHGCPGHTYLGSGTSDHGWQRSFPRKSPGYLGTRHMGPTAGPGASTCRVPHILPRHRGARQDSHLFAIALDGCTDAQCGFIVVLVL